MFLLKEHLFWYFYDYWTESKENYNSLTIYQNYNQNGSIKEMSFARNKLWWSIVIAKLLHAETGIQS